MPIVDEGNLYHDTGSEKLQQDPQRRRVSEVTNSKEKETPAPSTDSDEKRYGTVNGSPEQSSATCQSSGMTQFKKTPPTPFLGKTEDNKRDMGIPRCNLTRDSTPCRNFDQTPPEANTMQKRVLKPISAKETKTLKGILKQEVTLSRGLRKAVFFSLRSLTPT